MFKVLHSSAGAGKTHALVRHYLSLCLRDTDPGAYRRVLALTFTTKAAGEMQERVLQYLERIADRETGSPQIDDVVDHLVKESGATPDELAQRAHKVLGHMLHHWSDVAISTIDAFTRRVVRPFARDLQLDHELRMTTDEAHYRERAVDGLIAEAGVEPTVTALLTEACLQLLHEERKWDPGQPLLDLSRELGKESSIKPLELLRNVSPEVVAPLMVQLRKDVRAFIDQVRALGQEALRMISEAGLVPEDMAYGKGGIHGYFRKLGDFEASWEPPGKNALKTLESGKWYGGKASENAKETLERLAPELERLFQAAEDLREKSHPIFLVRRAVLRELPTAFALHELDRHLEAIKQADGIAFFSDLTRKVAAVVKHEPVPFIHERMGERYSHFLIDEFQDTSLMQWNALLPLIHNALGTDGSALLVGDAKQAIYRWRNGEVRLFTSFPQVFGRDPQDAAEAEREAALVRNYREAEALADNYRSAATIIRSNNKLFGLLAPLLPEGLRKVYEGHEQGVKIEREGLVLLEKLPSDHKGEQRLEATFDFTLRHVQEALADGFAPGDIAILVRSGKLGHALAAHLVANHLAVISPDGLRLSGDPVIELLIDLLRFMHQGDVTAAARILQYRSLLAGTAEAVAHPFHGGEKLPDPVRIVREHLAAHGHPRLRTTLTALLGELALSFGLRPGDDAQLLTLLDEVHAWTTEHGQDIGGFLEHFERRGGERGSAPPEHGQAILIMTVHGSKGLQFPVVIVPNANMGSGGNHGERFWIDPQQAVPELPVALVSESKGLREAGTPELLEEEELRLLDQMNLLYVAFTRPEQRLLALVPEYRADAMTKELLAFIDTEGSEEGRLVQGSRSAPWKRRDGSEQFALKDVSGHTPTTLDLRLEAPADWDPADPDPYRSHGNAVHEILAHMAHADDLDHAMERALDEGLLDHAKAPMLRERLRALITSPGMEAWFGKGLAVRNEATLITAEGKALRPDRVVMEGDRVGVLDIKTGQPREDHAMQVRNYMHHLRQLGHARVEGALLYVREGVLEPVAP
jgi:ATP-dependent helicase/nuclease subunit A